MFLTGIVVAFLHVAMADSSSSAEAPDWTGGRLPPFFPNGKDRPLPRYAPTFSRHTPYLTEDTLPAPVYGRYGSGPKHGFTPGGDSERSGPSIPRFNPDGESGPAFPRFSEKREFPEPFSGPKGETERERPSEFLPPRFGATGRIPTPDYFREKEGSPRREGGGDRVGFPELGKPYYPEYFRPDGSDGPADAYRPRVNVPDAGSHEEGPRQRGPPEGYRPRINVPSSGPEEGGPRQRYSGSGESDVSPPTRPRPHYRQEVPDEGPRGFRPPPEIYRPRYSEGEGFPEGRPRDTPPPGYRPRESPPPGYGSSESDDSRRPPESRESGNRPFREPGSGPTSNPARNPDLDERRPSQAPQPPPSSQPPQGGPQGGPQPRPFRPANASDQSAPHHETPRPAPPHGGDIELPGDKSRPDRLFAIRPPEFPPIPSPPPYPSISPLGTPATPPPLPGAYHFGTTTPTPPPRSGSGAGAGAKVEERSNQTYTGEVTKPQIPVYSPLSGPFPASGPNGVVSERTTVAVAPRPESAPAPREREPQEGPQQQQAPESEGTGPPKQKPQGLPSSFRSFFPPGFGPFEKGADDAKSKQ